MNGRHPAEAHKWAGLSEMITVKPGVRPELLGESLERGTLTQTFYLLDYSVDGSQLKTNWLTVSTSLCVWIEDSKDWLLERQALPKAVFACGLPSVKLEKWEIAFAEDESNKVMQNHMSSSQNVGCLWTGS